MILCRNGLTPKDDRVRCIECNASCVRARTMERRTFMRRSTLDAAHPIRKRSTSYLLESADL